MGALLLPGSNALAGGPVAHKSGAIVNYVTTGKVRVGKRIGVYFQCGIPCNVSSTLTIKGAGIHTTDVESGALQPNVPAFHFFRPSGPVLRYIKDHLSKFRLVSSVTATDPATGATDAISHTFRLKR